MLPKALIFRIAIFTVLLAGIAFAPARVQAAGCATTQQERNAAFKNHAYTVQSLGMLRAQLADIDTQDPAVIERQLKTARAAAANAYRHLQFSTGSEEAAWKKIYDGAQAYLEYWQARKANEVSGGMVDVPSADRFRSFTKERIARAEKNEQRQSHELADLDEQVQRCKAASGSHSNWNGTYVSGSYTMVISGGFGSLSYKADRNDGDTTDHTSGTCEVSGTEAKCKDKGTYHDSEKTVEREATLTLTLSGNTITAKSKVTKATVTLTSGQPCPDPAQCTGLHAGAEFESTWTKKP